MRKINSLGLLALIGLLFKIFLVWKKKLFYCKRDWKVENVLKHKSCLDPQIKYYGSIDFTRTYTKYEKE